VKYALRLSRLTRNGRSRLMDAEQAVLAEIRGLRQRLPYVAGVLVASADGLLVAHDAPGIQPETFAAMSAAHLGLGRQIAHAVRCGDFQETVTRAAQGYVATFAAGRSALLTVVAGPELNVGRLHHEARPVAARVGELVATVTRR
jgi:uncharacterized protein